MRVLRWIPFLLFFIWEIFRGTALDVAATFKGSSSAHPAIIEMPLRCRSDLEIALFAWVVTIPPGSAVIAIAAGNGNTPPSMFIHSLHQDTELGLRTEMRNLETRLLRVLRKGFVE